MAQVTFDVANEMESARQQSSGNSFDFSHFVMMAMKLL